MLMKITVSHKASRQYSVFCYQIEGPNDIKTQGS